MEFKTADKWIRVPSSAGVGPLICHNNRDFIGGTALYYLCVLATPFHTLCLGVAFSIENNFFVTIENDNTCLKKLSYYVFITYYHT